MCSPRDEGVDSQKEEENACVQDEWGHMKLAFGCHVSAGCWVIPSLLAGDQETADAVYP